MKRKINSDIKVNVSVGLDVAESWKFSAFGIFLWIPCIVHETHKYGIQQILS